MIEALDTFICHCSRLRVPESSGNWSETKSLFLTLLFVAIAFVFGTSAFAAVSWATSIARIPGGLGREILRVSAGELCIFGIAYLMGRVLNRFIGSAFFGFANFALVYVLLSIIGLFGMTRAVFLILFGSVLLLATQRFFSISFRLEDDLLFYGTKAKAFRDEHSMRLGGVRLLRICLIVPGTIGVWFLAHIPAFFTGSASIAYYAFEAAIMAVFAAVSLLATGLLSRLRIAYAYGDLRSIPTEGDPFDLSAD